MLVFNRIIRIHSGKLTWQWKMHPFESMYSLLNMGIFQPAMLVYRRVLQFSGDHPKKNDANKFCTCSCVFVGFFQTKKQKKRNYGNHGWDVLQYDPLQIFCFFSPLDKIPGIALVHPTAIALRSSSDFTPFKTGFSAHLAESSRIKR